MKKAAGLLLVIMVVSHLCSVADASFATKWNSARSKASHAMSGTIKRVVGSIVPDCDMGARSTDFIIHTSQYPDGVMVDINSEEIPVEKNTRTIILIHGFTEDVNRTSYLELNRIFIKLGMNVIDVDWSKGACGSGGMSLTRLLSYPRAVKNARVVGEYVAQFIGKLISDFGLELEDVTVIGHSLGAHVASFCAKYLQEKDIGTLNEIWGLDPAGPGFESNHCKNRICATDAKCVQIFHTSRSLGIHKPVGTTDFYYNGGAHQPGCGGSLKHRVRCSHQSSIRYLARILKDSDCEYIGKKWNRTDPTPSTLDCSEETCSEPGPLACRYPAKGIFHVDTTKLPENCVRMS